jgi:hypothetical protein
MANTFSPSEQLQPLFLKPSTDVPSNALNFQSNVYRISDSASGEPEVLISKNRQYKKNKDYSQLLYGGTLSPNY